MPMVYLADRANEDILPQIRCIHERGCREAFKLVRTIDQTVVFRPREVSPLPGQPIVGFGA